MRAMCKCATMESGVGYVTIVGITMKHKLYAGNLDFLLQVNLFINSVQA